MPTGKLPDTLRTLLAAFAPCFTVRTFPTFQASFQSETRAKK